MTIRFFLDYTRSDGFRKIGFTISEKGDTKRIKTDVYVDPGLWNQKDQKHKYKDVNEYLDSVRDRFSQIRSNAVRFGHETSAQYYYDQYKVQPQEAPEPSDDHNASDLDFIAYFDVYYDKFKNTYSHGHMRKITHIKQHFIDSGLNPTFEGMTLDLWHGYMDYLSAQGNTNNTIANHLKFVRNICKDALRNGYNVNPEYLDFKVRVYKIKPVWLYWDEVKKIAKANLSGSKAHVRDEFLIRAYTGLRDSDTSNLLRHHFRQRGKVWYVNIVVQKTEKPLIIPIHTKAMDIFEKYKYRIPNYSQQAKNRIIKKIAKDLELDRHIERVRYQGNKRVSEVLPLYDVISTHTARRTFGRKFMEETHNIAQLSQLFGHSDTKTTMEYIGWEDTELGEVVSNLDF